MTDPWHDAFEKLPDAREAETVDQKIAHAQVLALLAIAQELNHLNQGSTPLGEAILDALGD